MDRQYCGDCWWEGRIMELNSNGKNYNKNVCAVYTGVTYNHRPCSHTS